MYNSALYNSVLYNQESSDVSLEPVVHSFDAPRAGVIGEDVTVRLLIENTDSVTRSVKVSIASDTLTVIDGEITVFTAGESKWVGDTFVMPDATQNWKYQVTCWDAPDWVDPALDMLGNEAITEPITSRPKLYITYMVYHYPDYLAVGGSDYIDSSIAEVNTLLGTITNFDVVPTTIRSFCDAPQDMDYFYPDWIYRDEVPAAQFVVALFMRGEGEETCGGGGNTVGWCVTHGDAIPQWYDMEPCYFDFYSCWTTVCFNSATTPIAINGFSYGLTHMIIHEMMHQTGMWLGEGLDASYGVQGLCGYGDPPCIDHGLLEDKADYPDGYYVWYHQIVADAYNAWPSLKADFGVGVDSSTVVKEGLSEYFPSDAGTGVDSGTRVVLIGGAEPYLPMQTSIDIDNDGVVEPTDRITLFTLDGVSYGDPTYDVHCDLNYDGIIDDVDIDIFDTGYETYSNLVDIRTAVRTDDYQLLDWGDGFTCALQGCNQDGVESYYGKYTWMGTYPLIQIGFVSTHEHTTVVGTAPETDFLNPSFELWSDEYTPDNWTKEVDNGVVERNDVEVQNGSYSCKLSTSQVAGAYAKINQDATYGGTYLEQQIDIRFYYYIPTGSGGKLKVQVDYGTSLSEITTCDTELWWIHYLGRYVVPSDATQINLNIWLEGDDNGAYIVYIDNSSATFNFIYACYQRSIDTALGAYKALGYGHIMAAFPAAAPHAYAIFWTGTQPWTDLNNWMILEPANCEIFSAVNEDSSYDTSAIMFYDTKTLTSNINFHSLTVDTAAETVSYGSAGSLGDMPLWYMREDAVDTFDKFLGVITTDKTASDTGTGTDSFDNRGIYLTQPATGVETYKLTKDVTASDTGTGSENSILFVVAEVKTASDTGTGADSSALTIITAKTSSDTGSGSELSVQAYALTSSDSGTGAEATTRGDTPSDIGEGVEGMLFFLRDGFGDSGSGVESSIVVGSGGRLLTLVTHTGLQTS